MPVTREHSRSIAPAATPEEAAAIVAAVERFARARARGAPARDAAHTGWATAALLEGVQRDPGGWAVAGLGRSPWINT